MKRHVAFALALMSVNASCKLFSADKNAVLSRNKSTSESFSLCLTDEHGGTIVQHNLLLTPNSAPKKDMICVFGLSVEYDPEKPRVRSFETTQSQAVFEAGRTKTKSAYVFAPPYVPEAGELERSTPVAKSPEYVGYCAESRETAVEQFQACFKDTPDDICNSKNAIVQVGACRS